MTSLRDKIVFIQRVFGPCIISRDGINVAVKCPACSSDETKKKLSIRIDTDQCHCWVCGLKSKSLKPLLSKYFNNDLVKEYQRNFQSDKVKIFDDELSEEPEEEKIFLPEGFVFLAGFKHKDPDIRECVRYIRSRGLSDRDLWYFRFGTCSRGRFRRRVIMPSFDSGGKLNYYVARAIDADVKRKYINARVSKADVIFNEINIDWSQEITLVEGPFDLTKCDDNATCLLGSSFSQKSKLLQEIVRNNTPVLLALDSDMKIKTQEYAKLLLSYGIQIRILNLGSYNDVGEMSKADFLTAKKNAAVWKDTDRLYHLIDSIKSGTTL